MPFVKGTPKPPGSGRKKGSINKLALTVASKLEELGCDPIEGMALIAADRNCPRDVRVKCYAELAQYVYPKRKAVEHSGPGGGAIPIDVSGTKLLTSRIAELAANGEADGGTQQPD